MNWKTILLLSMFGIAMGLGTVFFVPTSVEPVLWLIIFLVSAYVVARNCEQLPFLSGLLVGLFDSLLKTGVHMIFFDAYVARHSHEIDMIRQMTTVFSPRLLILLSSPVWGLVFGTLIGVFAILFRVFTKRNLRRSAA
jgi:hypothetical protein